MEQVPDAFVGNTVDPAFVCASTASVDTLLVADASVSILNTCTASIESSSIHTSPSCAPTSTAVVSTPTTTYRQQHDADARTIKRRRTTSMQCVSVGDVRDVRTMSASNVDVNAVDDAGLSAVAYAATCGNYDATQVLLAAKGTPVVVCCGSAIATGPPLTVNAPVSPLSTCAASIESSSIPTSPSCEPTTTAVVSTPTCSLHHALNTHTNKRGHTKLMRFAIAGTIRRVEVLIAAGVDVNVVDDAGLSAVAYAAACGHRDVMQVLLAAKAAPVVVSEGIAALVERLRVERDHKYYVDVLEMLLRIKPRLQNQLLSWGDKTMYAEEKDEEDTKEGERREGEEDKCVDCGDDVVFVNNIVGKDGYELPHPPDVTVPKDADESPYPADISEWEEPLLYWAAKHGYVDVVKLLLAAGADVRQRFCIQYLLHGETAKNALHIACECGHVEVVKVLLAAGATSIIDNIGSLAEVYYDGEYYYEFEDMTALHVAVDGGHVEVVQVLIAAGVDVDARSSDDATALYRAARADRMELVRMLLAASANVNAKDTYGKTPLHVAVASGNVHVVQLLLAAGADVTATDEDGETALHKAMYQDDKEVLNSLLDPDAFCANARATGTDNRQ